jgi:hypothetical protein
VKKDRAFYLVLSFDKKPDMSECDYFVLYHLDKKKRALLKAVKQSEVFPKQLKTFHRDAIHMLSSHTPNSFVPDIYEDKSTATEWRKIFGEKK